MKTKVFVLMATLLALALGPARAQGPDIALKSAQALYGGGSLQFLLTFTAPILPYSVGGYIDIDTDQNGATGGTSWQEVFLAAPPTPLLGIEFYVDLFTASQQTGRVELFRTGFINSRPVDIAYGIDTLSVLVPLTDLAGDDGLVNFGAIVGPLTDAPTSFSAPAASVAASSSAIPEPATLALALPGLLGLALRRRRAG